MLTLNKDVCLQFRAKISNFFLTDEYYIIKTLHVMRFKVRHKGQPHPGSGDQYSA